MLASHRTIMLSLMILVTLLPLTAVSPVSAKKQQGITWSRTYSQIIGSAFVQQTSDEGFVVVGAYFTVWVLKTGALGLPEWERDYSPPGYYSSEVGSVQQTRDGGYLVAGSASHTGYARVDGWLLKLDRLGNVQWSKTYGGLADDGFYVAKETVDEGYVVAGNTASVSSHVFNGWILKLDSFGNVVWQEAFVGEDIHSVDHTRDGGFVVAGTVGVAGKADAWVFKLDPEGKVVWQKAYEVAVRTEALSIREVSDGGYIVSGHSSLGDLILRLDLNGDILWQKSNVGSGFTISSITETSDHGLIVVANSSTGPFLLKLDSRGDMVWQKTYDESGGFFHGYFSEAQETRDEGLIVSGALPTAGWNAWALRLGPEGGIQGCPFGVPSNATITDTQAIVANTNVTAVGANEGVIQTSMNVTAVNTSVQTQCFFSVQDDADGRNSPPSREGNDHSNSRRDV